MDSFKMYSEWLVKAACNIHPHIYNAANFGVSEVKYSTSIQVRAKVV